LLLGVEFWNKKIDRREEFKICSVLWFWWLFAEKVFDGFVVKAQKMNCWKILFMLFLLETIPTAKWFWSTTLRNHFHSKMVMEYNSQKPFLSSSSNCVSPKLNDDNGSWSLVFFTCWKPLSTSNGFGVQLTETISTTKWFWHNFIQNMYNHHYLLFFINLFSVEPSLIVYVFPHN